MSAVAPFRQDVADWVLAMPVAVALGFSFVELADGRGETELVCARSTRTRRTSSKRVRSDRSPISPVPLRRSPPSPPDRWAPPSTTP